MQARGPLMTEHRKIERMIKRIAQERDRIDAERKVDPVFVDTAVDFIRVYADQLHHGKEEDILFAALDGKELSDEHRDLMNRLIDEHVFGRKKLKELEDANAQYRQGDNEAVSEISQVMNTLTEFYPQHIAKEDDVFFPAAMEYLSEDEQQHMLKQYIDFDADMIHHKYEDVLKSVGV